MWVQHTDWLGCLKETIVSRTKVSSVISLTKKEYIPTCYCQFQIQIITERTISTKNNVGFFNKLTLDSGDKILNEHGFI